MHIHYQNRLANIARLGKSIEVTKIQPGVAVRKAELRS
jgi:hypothetical protein